MNRGLIPPIFCVTFHLYLHILIQWRHLKIFTPKQKKGFIITYYLLHRIKISPMIFSGSLLQINKKIQKRFFCQFTLHHRQKFVFDEYNRKKQHINIDLVEPVYSKKNSDDNLELEKVLKLLDDDEKKLFIMAVTDDLSYEEISRLTGVSVSNIKVKIQ